jgi:hypothetical protein
MGAVILFAALSLALSALTPLLAVAQTPTALTPTDALASSASGLIRPELALLPNAPEPAATVITTPVAPCLGGPPGKSNATEPARTPCLETVNPYTPFLNSTAPAPLTREQKAVLAVHNFRDPGNLASIVYLSAIAIGTDAHTAYGPGWKGFGENAGYRVVRNATGEFVGTFLIPSLTHQDPRYHRMPDASLSHRILHAVSHTVIAQGDNGTHMPNYAVLVGTPIRAEIANLYIPGVQCNLPGTAQRVLTSYAAHPVDDLITEFLPDVARHVHVRALFLQRILNNVPGDH